MDEIDPPETEDPYQNFLDTQLGEEVRGQMSGEYPSEKADKSDSTTGPTPKDSKS